MATKKKKKKQAVKTKAVSKKKPVAKKKTKEKKAKPVPKKLAPIKKPVRKKSPRRKGTALDTKPNLRVIRPPSVGQGARSGGQSGDLQGLSDIAEVDSESVDELLEEGNALEAEVVEGVENVPDADQGEVTTHEVPEDDVPEEYLNDDR
jgi:hypothetical protein